LRLQPVRITRQSYTMAVVPPEERAAASGITGEDQADAVRRSDATSAEHPAKTFAAQNSVPRVAGSMPYCRTNR